MLLQSWVNNIPGFYRSWKLLVVQILYVVDGAAFLAFSNILHGDVF